MEYKCKCGCEEEIIEQYHHKYYGVPSFISGHNTSLNPYFLDGVSYRLSIQKIRRNIIWQMVD